MIPEGKFKDFLRYARRAVLRRRIWPAVGDVQLGDFERVTPVSDNWGFDRGTPVDRFYIESFISEFADDIRGRVLEIYDDVYTARFGGDRVSHRDILHNRVGLDRATMVLDLTRTGDASGHIFDCIICTQTLQLIYEKHAAVQTLYKLLKPGGVVLLTVPGITQSPREGMGGYSDYWRFTSSSVRRLVAEVFGSDNVEVRSFGNVYSSVAFLHGLAVEELDKGKLSHSDSDYEMLIASRATKPIDSQ